MDTTTADAASIAATEASKAGKKLPKTKKPPVVQEAQPEAPIVKELEGLFSTTIENIKTIIAKVKGTGSTHAKAVRPFKRAAEEQLRLLGWAVLDAKMLANMQRLNGDRAVEKAERDAKKAQEALSKAEAKANALKAAAAEALAKAEAHAATLRGEKAN